LFVSDGFRLCSRCFFRIIIEDIAALCFSSLLAARP
jgi:hypothetical protein